MLDLFQIEDQGWMHDAAGFSQRVGRALPVPHMTASAYDRASTSRRDAYDRQRFAYMNEAIVRTQSIETLRKRLLRAMLLNRNAKTGRAGVLISGSAGLGKTTAVRALAGWTVSRYQRQFPQFLDAGDIPAIYVSVPPPATPRSMIARLASSIHIPVRARDTAETLMREIAPQLQSLHTQLLIVDEIHRLATGSREHLDTTDVLKDLSDLVPCTFVYAGIAIEKSGLLSGERGAQLAGRFSLARMTPYLRENRGDWDDVVAGFEQRSCLFGSIDVSPDYLLARSHGSIGVLHALFTQAIGLKLSQDHAAGDESLTQEDFEESIVPMDAEEIDAMMPPAVSAGRAARRKT